MSQTPLDELREQLAAEQKQSRPRLSRVLLIALIATVGGLVLGYLGARAYLVPPVPQTVELSEAEKDDYILMVAEAYAADRNIPMAQQRLARLNDPRTTERIIALAQAYAPQQDYVAQRLALLAVAAGSKDKTLRALAATLVAPTRVPTLTRSLQQTGTPAPAVLAGTATPYYVVVTGVPTDTPTPYYIVVTGVPTETGVPTKTFTPHPPTWTPTPVVSTEDERPEAVEPMPVKFVGSTIPVNVPGYTGVASAEIRLAARPKECTPADRMPAVVTETTLLCGGQTYAPFEIQGNNITLYGDAGGTALIAGQPRQFAITVQGTNVAIAGVHVQGATDGSDMEQWLCLYPRCPYTPEIGGAMGYGGGILLKNTVNAAVMDSQFNTGTAGVFVLRGYSNKLFRNRFGDLNGWGILLMQTRRDYIVGNSFARINRACTGLDNVYHANGCESSALAMTNVRDTLVLNNSCRSVSNCYYANGDGGYGSANIKFYNDRCAGAKNNCFEVTFGQGHEFDYNTAVYDADSGENCDYPIWIGGSTAYFGSHNEWNCLHDYDTAVNDSRSKSDQPTNALALVERPTVTPSPTLTRRAFGAAKPATAKPTPGN